VNVKTALHAPDRWLLLAALLISGCGGGGSGSTSTTTPPQTTIINSSTVAVDFGSKHQVIRGFGGSTAWMGAIGQVKISALFGTGAGQLGLSILRARIDPSGSAASNWVTANWGQELTNTLNARTANPNAIVIATPWTPPAIMKSNNNSVMGTLNASSYAAYAGYLESFVNYFASGGAPLYAISMQNEPDANVTYESCSWNGSSIDSWVASLSANGATNPITTRLMIPEAMGFNTAYSDTALNDANAVANISIVAGHLYGTSPFYYTNAVSKGKEVWETEHYLSPAGSQPTISDALSAAREIHNSLVTGQYNAYLWWWLIDWNPGNGITNDGLIDTNNNPTYFGYALGQYARFIQPGYVRTDVAPASPVSGVYISAYSNGSPALHFTIVAINSNTSAVSQPFTLANTTNLTSLTPYQTTSSGGLGQQGAISVTGGQFTYTLPAQSIVTFVQ
jgi:glucuronoarabinoxylan endo-1,4-beta-xylanase